MTEIAVVIPAHDAAPFLAEALRSVREQSLSAVEVIVVDDGSSDGTHAIAESEGVRCVRQPQGGPAAARNRGVRETTAPLVAFLDADDWFTPEKLATQAQRLESSGAPACCSDAFVLRKGRREGRKNARRAVPERITFDHLLADNPVICSTVLARRDALEEAGGFDEDPVLIASEDYDLWLRMARRAPLLYVDEPLACYRAHDSGLSDNRRFLAGVDRIMEKVLEQDDDGSLRRRAEHRRASVRIDLACDLIRSGAGAEARSLVREARKLGAPWARCVKITLRSFLG